LAYERWPDESYGIDGVADDGAYTYKGMNVLGFDGSKFMLPAAPELREECGAKRYNVIFSSSAEFSMSFFIASFDSP
jgi:hypothetical protein